MRNEAAYIEAGFMKAGWNEVESADYTALK